MDLALGGKVQMLLTVETIKQQEPHSPGPPANRPMVAASCCVATESGPYAVLVVPPDDCAKRPATRACLLRATDARPDAVGQCCASSRRHCWRGPPVSRLQASDQRQLATLGPSLRATAEAALPRSSHEALPTRCSPRLLLPPPRSPPAD